MEVLPSAQKELSLSALQRLEKQNSFLQSAGPCPPTEPSHSELSENGNGLNDGYEFEPAPPCESDTPVEPAHPPEISDEEPLCVPQEPSEEESDSM